MIKKSISIEILPRETYNKSQECTFKIVYNSNYHSGMMRYAHNISYVQKFNYDFCL